MRSLIKSIFCCVNTVSCVSGHSVERIYRDVERGGYLWVWNVSAGAGPRRELRFWSPAINKPAATASLSLNSVIRAIIPLRSHVLGQGDGLYNWEFRHLLRLSKSSMHQLRAELGVEEVGKLFIPRSNLEDFLCRRWLGNIKLRCHSLPPASAPEPASLLL